MTSSTQPQHVSTRLYVAAHVSVAMYGLTSVAVLVLSLPAWVMMFPLALSTLLLLAGVLGL